MNTSMKMTLLTPDSGPLARYRASLELAFVTAGWTLSRDSDVQIGVGVVPDHGTTRLALVRASKTDEVEGAQLTAVMAAMSGLTSTEVASEGYGSMIVQSWLALGNVELSLPPRSTGPVVNPSGATIARWESPPTPSSVINVDCPQLGRDLIAIHRGERPQAFSPLFPSRLPQAPSRYQTAHGEAEGVLALAWGVPMVLSLHALRAREWASNPDLQWEDLHACPPFPFVCALAGDWRTRLHPAGM
jgi:hypothetical protein